MQIGPTNHVLTRPKHWPWVGMNKVFIVPKKRGGAASDWRTPMLYARVFAVPETLMVRLWWSLAARDEPWDATATRSLLPPDQLDDVLHCLEAAQLARYSQQFSAWVRHVPHAAPAVDTSWVCAGPSSPLQSATWRALRHPASKNTQWRPLSPRLQEEAEHLVADGWAVIDPDTGEYVRAYRTDR